MAGDVVDQFGPAVAVDVAPHGRFVTHVVQRQVLLPGARLAGRILVPIGLLAGEGHVEHVGPAVAVEIARVGEEIVGVAVRIVGLGLVNLVADLEIGPLVPIRPGHDVQLAVLVEIGVIGPFGVELVAEHQLFEGRQRRLRPTHGRAQRQHGQAQNQFSHGMVSDGSYRIRCGPGGTPFRRGGATNLSVVAVAGRCQAPRPRYGRDTPGGQRSYKDETAYSTTPRWSTSQPWPPPPTAG